VSSIDGEPLAPLDMCCGSAGHGFDNDDYPAVGPLVKAVVQAGGYAQYKQQGL